MSMQSTRKPSWTGLVELGNHPLVDFLPLRGAFTAVKAIRNLKDNGKQGHMLNRRVSNSTLLSATGFFGSQRVRVNKGKQSLPRNQANCHVWMTMGLPTVRAEVLPLLAPPILLGVVLPELGSLGGGEKMVTNWFLGGGGNITQSVTRNIHFLSK
jgi:hypothetical protein